MKDELISIIIPVFNGEKTIKRAIDSVLAQIDVNVEVVIVDDGSTDNTKAICQEIVNGDPRVNYYHIENHGVSFARNYALKKAKGKYIGFVDSDDYIDVDMYKTLLSAIIDNEAQLSICGLYDEWNGKVVKDSNEYSETIINQIDLYADVFRNSDIGGYLCNKLFVKNYITDYLDETVAQCEDFLFVIQYIKKIQRAVFVKKKLYHYVREMKQYDFNYSVRSLSLMTSYEKIYDFYKENAPAYMSDIRKNLLKIYLNFRARYIITKDNNKDLKKQINNGIKTYFNSVLFDHKILFFEKANIILTFTFPRTILKLKSKVLFNQYNGD